MFYNKAIWKRCFHFPKRYWYKNIKYIPLYFRLMHDLIKHGYDEYATWETFSWFTTTMRSILERYRDGHCGVPILIDNYPYDSNANDEESKNLREQNDKLWDDTIDRMIELLKLMDEDCPKYDTEEYNGMDGWKKKDADMDKAKDEFFKLFSEHFWRLWD